MSELHSRVNHEPAFLLSAGSWRETSLLIEVFSRRHGRVAMVARSARKRQSELRGVLVPFVPLSLSWFGAGEVKTLHRAEWVGGWPQPQHRQLFSALYVNELVLKLTAREDPAPGIFDALHRVFGQVCAPAAPQRQWAELRYFEWALLQQLGVAPDIACDADGKPVEDGAWYRIRPESAPEKCAAPEHFGSAGDGVPVPGSALAALRTRTLHERDVPRSAVLQLTRCLIDFRLPEGLHSRNVLLQMQQKQNQLAAP